MPVNPTKSGPIGLHAVEPEGPPQILIVEDNSFNIIAIQAVLQELGINYVDVAMNGKEAVDNIQLKL